MCTRVHIFFCFFHWHYSPLWALACQTMSFHFFLSATNSLHLLTPSTWRSLSTSYFHLFLGLPLLLVPSSSWVKIFLGILSSSILSRWPNQLILCPFIHFTIFSPLHISTRVHIVYICIPCPLTFWKFVLALNSMCEHNISTKLVPTVTAFQNVDGATSSVCHVCFVYCRKLTYSWISNGLQWHNFYIIFNQNPSSSFWLQTCTWTETWSICKEFILSH